MAFQVPTEAEVLKAWEAISAEMARTNIPGMGQSGVGLDLATFVILNPVINAAITRMATINAALVGLPTLPEEDAKKLYMLLVGAVSWALHLGLQIGEARASTEIRKRMEEQGA